jgi:hypothetical protein
MKKLVNFLSSVIFFLVLWYSALVSHDDDNNAELKFFSPKINTFFTVAVAKEEAMFIRPVDTVILGKKITGPSRIFLTDYLPGENQTMRVKDLEGDSLQLYEAVLVTK